MLFQQLCKPIIREVFQDPFGHWIKGTGIHQIEIWKSKKSGQVIFTRTKIIAFTMDFQQFTSHIWGGITINPTTWLPTTNQDYVFLLDNGKMFEGEYSTYEIVDVDDFKDQDNYGDQVLAAKETFDNEWVILLDNGSTITDGDEAYDRLTARL